MLIGGAAWISFISLFNVQVLNQAPDWVRARVLAVSMLVFQGAVAAGSAAWGSRRRTDRTRPRAAMGRHRNHRYRRRWDCFCASRKPVST